MADPFTVVRGACAPLLESNISTNTISVQKAHGPGGIEEGLTRDDLLAPLRFDTQGNPIPDFVLNRPQFSAAKFLLTGANFGCGSSREAAVHVLVAFGIRCVIAPSFGEIFYNNCFKNGVLPIVVSEAEVLSLAEKAEPGGSAAVFTADLPASKLVTPSGRDIRIALPRFRRQQLLEGLDEIELTQRRASEIVAFHRTASELRPWAYRMTGG